MTKYVLVALVLLGTIYGFTLLKSVESPILNLEELSLPGASVLAFGPDNILFVGDSKNGVVYAFQTTGTAVENPVPYNLTNFDLILAKKLDVSPRDLVIRDMKMHPASQEVYLAVKKDHKPDTPAMIAVVNAKGEIHFLDVKTAMKGKVNIKNPASTDLKFWRDIPASTLTITDIDYYDGNIYVAGLSNGEFASTLRKIAYPFTDKQDAVKGIEIYHAVHTQMETRAPIRTMTISDLGGTPTLIASYTCTPLVTIPLSEIKEGNAIKGKTVAELGYGNTPIDMITYMAQEQDGSFDEKLLVTQKHRSGSFMSLKEVGKAMAEGEGMVGTMAMNPTGTAGLHITPIPTSAVLHIDNQGQMFVGTLKRNLETGGLDLVSELKGSFLRLSEFISEYDFPDYKYPENQAMTKQFHDMVKPMEGYPELTSDKTKK